jgi:serine protease
MTRFPAWLPALLMLGACTVDTTVESTLGVDDTPGIEGKFIRVDQPIARKYIVVFEEPKDALARGAMDVNADASQLATSFSANVTETWEHALHGFAAEMDEADAERMAEDPRVAFVQEDGVVYASGTQSGATWGLDRIDQAALPLSGSYTYPNDGSGVTAYIIDTGIRTSHTSFGGRASGGYSAINDGNGTNDCNGHGTHVAGTVGSSTWGVAKNVRLVAVRVLGCNGSGSDSGVVSGMNWVAQNHSGPSVANMSLGGGASTATDTAIRNATNAGVTMVVAAGNENSNACNGSPARAPEAITVASSTSSDARSSFSNYGSCVDIFAPGSNITSANYNSTSGSTTMSGTSMASPHVAGAAALYLSANPSATPAQVTAALTNNATPNRISNASGSPNKLLNVSFIGSGGGGDDPPPPPPPGDGTPQTGSASGSVARGSFVNYQPLSVLGGTTFDVQMSGSGDPDLYVRFGARPTLSTFHCRSWSNTATERCTITVPAGQTSAYISVYGYTAASYTISASWVEP